MANFYSLPPEMIRHILSLAYPPGEDGSAKGLCATALVHSDWREPSVSVMTEEINFVGDDESIEMFIEKGPSEFYVQSVGFWGCEGSQVEAVLAKAAPGAVKELKMGHPDGSFPESIFSLASTRGVELLWLKASWYDHLQTSSVSEADSDWSSQDESESDQGSEGPTVIELMTCSIEFSPWPSTLRHLIVEAHDLPEQLLTTSARTLTRLDIGSLSTCCCFYDSLLPVAPSLISLTQLVILKLAIPGPFNLPHNLAPAIGAFPALESLILPRLTPHQLELILTHINPTQPLRLLWTPLFSLNDDPDYLDSPDWDDYGHQDKGKWFEEWVPTLRRCVDTACMAGLEVWRVSVVVTELGRSSQDSELKAKEIRKWRKTKQGWAQFLREVKAKGVKLMMGPL